MGGGGSQLANDAYGHTVFFSTDNITDTYVVGGVTTYQFPAGTSQGVVYVTIAIQFNLTVFMAALQFYVQGQFPTTVQLQFVCMYLAAQSAGLTNRANYIAQLLTWLNAIEAYAVTYVAAVQAMQNPATIAATVFDSTQFAVAPAVTLLGAIQIGN